MTTESCGNCRFHKHNDNACRRFPATPVFYGMQQPAMQGGSSRAIVMGHYAPQPPTEWCGEWQAETPKAIQ